MINFLGITARIQGISRLFWSLFYQLSYFFLEIFNATLAIRVKTIEQNMINMNCSRQSVLEKENTKIRNK